MIAGRFVAAWLKAQGVDTVFGLVGEHTLPFVSSLGDEGIRFIGCRHEQGAVLAAEAYGKVSRKPGIATVTAGPGVTNAVTGLAVANSCGSPVMLIAGRTSVEKRLTGTFQDIDGTAIVKAATKWTDTCAQAERLNDYLSAAWRRMLAGRPGSVMLEIPSDTIRQEIDLVPQKVIMPEPAGASTKAINEALKLLDAAEHPVIIAGSGAFWSGAGDALRSFSERARIPFSLVNAARGIIPDGSETSLGPLSEAGPILLQADLVMLIGTKLDASVTFGGPPLFTGNEKLIQVDIEPISIGLNRTPELALLGDARVVCEQLADGWDFKTKDAWLASSKELSAQMHAAWASQATGDGSPVPPGRIVGELINAAGPDSILISDGGDIHTWAVTTFPCTKPGSQLGTHDSLGTIGVGVPYALGAKAAAPERDVVLLIGDGSFGFGAMELETAARNNLPFTAVIANNGAWGNIRHVEGLHFQKTIGTALEPVAYEHVALAVGGFGERVDDAANVGPAIQRALKSGKPAVVNVITPQDAVSPITQMLGGMQSML
ncbi:MAG: thiamine pyrophosphate-binding protein [Actinomycetota bacterium]